MRCASVCLLLKMDAMRVLTPTPVWSISCVILEAEGRGRKLAGMHPCQWRRSMQRRPVTKDWWDIKRSEANLFP